MYVLLLTFDCRYPWLYRNGVDDELLTKKFFWGWIAQVSRRRPVGRCVGCWVFWVLGSVFCSVFGSVFCVVACRAVGVGSSGIDRCWFCFWFGYWFCFSSVFGGCWVLGVQGFWFGFSVKPFFYFSALGAVSFLGCIDVYTG